MHLFERQAHLERLDQCLQEARSGCGKVVLVAGDAGIGKSSMVERFTSAHRRDVRALWGACDALATPRALAPVHEIAAQTLVQRERAESADESLDGLFRALLEDLAKPGRASLVVLEDLHWADEATLDFVRFLGRRIQRTSAVFIVTYREEELSQRHPVRVALGDLTGDHVVRLRLAPLSPAAVAELARDSGRDAVHLHEVTGGNPFFVREVLASSGDRVPETVRDAVIARLERCPAAGRQLAELVSMSPARTEAWLVEFVLGSRPTPGDAGTRGLLEIESEWIGFRHELARLAVHSTIPPAHVRALHDDVLRALAEHGAHYARLVHHAAHARNTTMVLRYAPLAANEAASLGSHRESAAHLKTALDHGGLLGTAARAVLLECHARECGLANETIEAIGSAVAAADAWEELGDAQAQARVLSFVSDEYRTVGDRRRADECVTRAIALAESTGRGQALAVAYCARSSIASNRGWDKEALEFGLRAVSLSREAGDVATESHALGIIGSALLGANDPSGYESLERGLALALDHKLEELAARAYRYALFYSVLIHDFARADRLFREGLAYCEERGIFRHGTYIRAYYTPCDLERGRWTEAARVATELLGSAAVGAVQQRVTVLATLALVRVRRGDPGADELLDQALALALPTCELNRIGRVTAARAEQAWYRGETDRVAREAAIGLEHICGHTAPWIKGELLWWSTRGECVDADRSDVAEPWRLMLAGSWNEASAAWERLEMPYEQALALALSSDEEALRASLAILDRLGAGPLAAIVRRSLREQGARNVPRGPNESTRANPAGLTAREIEVLRLLANGCTNAQLARRLHRSTKTVEHHVAAVLEKLDVHSRAQAVSAAFSMGIIEQQQSASSPGKTQRSQASGTLTGLK